MKYCRILLFTIFAVIVTTTACYAGDLYPDTLDSGNLILVDAGMGVGKYADRSSVNVRKYAPPNYEIAINIIPVFFSEEYCRKHKTYLNGPYTIQKPFCMTFRYNWNRKAVSYERHDGTWVDWNINRDNSHADGEPLVPNTAETAFVTAYNMRFFNNMMRYSPTLKSKRRVIDESFYRILNI